MTVANWPTSSPLPNPLHKRIPLNQMSGRELRIQYFKLVIRYRALSILERRPDRSEQGVSFELEMC